MSEQDMHVEDAMDSKLAKVAVRIFVWIVPFVIATFAWFITSQLGDIKRMQSKQGTLQEAQAESIGQVTSDVKVINAKLDTGVIWRLSELERRISTVEQAQKTP